VEQTLRQEISFQYRLDVAVPDTRREDGVMPIIQARLARNPKGINRCECCGKLIQSKTRQIAIYGYAHSGEKPYWIYYHFDFVKDTAGLHHPVNKKMAKVIREELDKESQ
jgi:hypothetical protein